MAVYQKTSMIVRQHNPWRLPLILLGLLAFMVVGGLLVYEYGRANAGLDLVRLEDQRDHLKLLIDQFEQERDQVRDALAVAKRSSEIDKRATEEIKGVVRGLQDEILELKAELAFYRNIVSPSVGDAGLRVQRFRIQGERSQRAFKYSLMLTQVLKNTRLARGRVEITISGLRDGAPYKVALHKKLAAKRLSFRFKYFQSLEADFELPERFVPTNVELKVVPTVRGLHRITETYAWAKVNEE